MNSSATLVQDPEQRVGFFINRNYTFLFFGQLISLIGDQVFDITLTIWVGAILAKGQSWAPAAVSGTLIAAYTPIFLIAPLAGVFVDRWNRRLTMIRMDIIRTILIATLIPIAINVSFPFMPHGDLPIAFKIGYIYIVVFLASTCAQFFNPSRFALIGDVVSDKHRAHASGLGQASLALSIILGPPLAAPLLFGIGLQWALIVDALTFIVSFAAISFVQGKTIQSMPEKNPKASLGSEFMEGLRYVFSNPTLRAMIIAVFIALIGTGTFEALYLFFIINNLHAAAGQIGFFAAAVGFGALIGAVVAGMISNYIGNARMIKISFALIGVFFILLSRQTTLVPALIIAFGIGVTQSGLNVPFAPIFLRVAPRDMIGRIEGILNPAFQLGQFTGVVTAGWLASTALASFQITIAGFAFNSFSVIFAGAGIFILAGAALATITLREPPPVPVPAPA